MMKSKPESKPAKAPMPEDQSARFRRMARELEADEDERHWDERLKKVARAKPAPEKPE